MNMRPITLAVGITILAATVSSFGQVIIRGTQSSDQSSGNSASSSAVTIDTGDRNVVPLIKETKDTKVDATTQRTESVTRARLDDGSYFEWQRSTTVKKDDRTGAVGQFHGCCGKGPSGPEPGVPARGHNRQQVRLG